MAVRDSTLLTGGQLPDEPGGPGRPTPTRRRLPGWLAFVRNIWRQLTSMRTALILLFLLALAALPGALLPQWSLNQAKTAQYILDHGWWGLWLNRLGFFEVFSSPWYAAIYLLLFTSLVGCLIPRSWDFARALRMPPVATPRNLARLPLHSSSPAPEAPGAVADRVQAGLTGWRVARRVEADGAIAISAEKGFLREVGNLVFHLSLLGLLVAIAVGKMFGYEGSIIVTAGGDVSGFCSASPAVYDNFRPGLMIDGTDLSPFCVQVDSFQAEYTDVGQASSFRAEVRYQSGGGLDTDTWQAGVLEVNDPLRIAGQRLYLLGHGYTPTFTVTYPDGGRQTAGAPFQPQDSMFTSQGAVKFPNPPGLTGTAMRQHQLAVVGIFAPTALVHGGIMTSTFPAAEAPGVAVDIYRGDLGLESGRAQSIFTIDQGQVDSGALKKVDRTNLAPGEAATLDDGTKVAFTGYREWVSLQTSYDPAQGWALVFAVVLLAGLMLSLTVKRRRVWFRIRAVGSSLDSTGGFSADATAGPSTDSAAGPSDGASPGAAGAGRSLITASTVDIGGLARTDQAGYGAEFEKIAALATPGSGPLSSSGRTERADRHRKGI